MKPLVEFIRFRVYRDEVATLPRFRSRLLMAPVERVNLTMDDISEMLRLSGRGHDEGVLQRRFERSDSCLGIRANGRLIAHLWAVFHRMDYGCYTAALHENEAYMMDGFVDPEYRGKGLALYMYTQLIQMLKEMDIQYVYSITEVDNNLASPLRGRVHSELVDSGFVLKFLGRWRVGTRVRTERLRT